MSETLQTLQLTVEEIDLLIDALESAEYWEHKDVLPHGSGYIYDPDSSLEPYTLETDEEREAWEEVKKSRALCERLSGYLRKES